LTWKSRFVTKTLDRKEREVRRKRSWTTVFSCMQLVTIV
jgi:hypothetical protein